MSMSKHEIERALIELRLSGMAATLETRILQAQASGQPFPGNLLHAGAR